MRTQSRDEVEQILFGPKRETVRESGSRRSNGSCRTRFCAAGCCGLCCRSACDGVLLEAVSSLVISVAILDVAKYVMEEEVLRSRELRDPSEAREAITKFMVIIALVVAIEGIVLVFELGNAQPKLLLYPILLLAVSVLIVVGLGIFQRLSLHAEKRLADAKDEPDIR